MSDTKWTPGPWGAADHGVGDLVVFRSDTQRAICIFDDDGQAYAWPDGYCTSGEAEANADLIAAAPEMADALRQWQHAEETGDDAEVANARVARDAALSKARGES